MAVIVVGGAEPEAGATTVAVGVAHRLAYAGHSVRIERLGGDDRATADAALFATLDFATSSGEPLAADASLSGDGVTVVEAATGGDAAAIAQRAGGRALIVGPTAAAPAGVTVIANHATEAGLLALIEDRLLAAPTVGRLIEASNARVLARSTEGDASICEHIVVGPIFEDSNEPHFERFARKAVVTRSEKVDIALSALLTETRCLILTGGNDPSAYLLDRVASDRNTTLLLAPGGTVETVHAIEGTFGSTPFAGAEKIERAGELMAAAIDDSTLASLLGGG
ncbi:MAG: DRTGG domain-containing protein [Dehalococcoidia bacterium]